MQPKRLRITQPVYLNLNYKEDKEFWDDIHSDQIPNFTRWVKSQWMIWKHQVSEETNKIYHPKITQENYKPQIETENNPTESTEPITQEKPKSMNVNSLTKMFGMKIS